MKLEEGMYVRLNCNYVLGIGKTIGEIDEDNFIKTKFKDGFECSLPTYMIAKASRNIIDLIEVGDYVNGKKVGYIDDCDGAMREYYYDYEDINVDVGHFFEEIKSIVTKEQFESMSYEVE